MEFCCLLDVRTFCFRESVFYVICTERIIIHFLLRPVFDCKSNDFNDNQLSSDFKFLDLKDDTVCTVLVKNHRK